MHFSHSCFSAKEKTRFDLKTNCEGNRRKIPNDDDGDNLTTIEKRAQFLLLKTYSEVWI